MQFLGANRNYRSSSSTSSVHSPAGHTFKLSPFRPRYILSESNDSISYIHITNVSGMDTINSVPFSRTFLLRLGTPLCLSIIQFKQFVFSTTKSPRLLPYFHFRRSIRYILMPNTIIANDRRPFN